VAAARPERGAARLGCSPPPTAAAPPAAHAPLFPPRARSRAQTASRCSPTG
jgi:hypothetical protein